MTVVNPKSISGITSITTASGSDNLLTIHTSDANNTERLRIDSTGTTKIVTGIVTTLTATTGIVTTLTANTVTSLGDVDIADKIVHTGDTNTAIRFPAADTVTVETGGSERFRIDSSGFMGLGTNSPTDTGGYGQALDITGGSSGAAIYLRASNGDTGQIALGSADLTIRTRQADPIIFSTDNSERARIDSSGRLLLGTTTEGQASADDLTIATSGNTGITLRSGTSNAGNIYFSDATSGTAEYAGYVSYSHSTNRLSFGTNDGTERFVINSDGRSHFVGSSSGGFSSTTLPNGNTVCINTKVSNDGVSVIRYSGSYGPYALNIGRSKSDTLGTNSIVANGDDLGHITWYGADGSDFNQAAAITVQVDGTPSNGTDMPGRILFKTTPDGSGTVTERLRINSTGLVSVGDAISGMDMGFGNQLFSAKSGTYSAAIFGSTSSSVTTSIIYNSNTSFGGSTSMCDWRAAASNSSAWYFLRLSSNSASDNEFFLAGDGNAYADGSWSGGGADYAEYFEWSDGNTSDEDRRGMTVVLDGTKIKIATSSDSTDNIIGVVSGNPSMIGDAAYCKWTGKYQRDDYNSYVRDSNGARVLNSDYDDTKTYLPRKDRKEWDAIGMVGKLRVRKGQQTGTRWIKMKDVSDTIEEWLVR